MDAAPAAEVRLKQLTNRWKYLYNIPKAMTERDGNKSPQRVGDRCEADGGWFQLLWLLSRTFEGARHR